MEHPITSISGYKRAFNSIGYVKKYDGKVQVVVADGDSVRLVPVPPPETIVQAIPRGTPSEPTTTVETATARESKAGVTVASSSIGDPATQ